VEPGGVISTVIGTGVPSTAGEAGIASALPVRSPASVDVDSYGNLFVTSTEAVRVVSAGEDGIARGDDEAATLFGAPPRSGFPEAATFCARGISLDPTRGDSSRLYFVDACQGFLIELVRQTPIDVPLPGEQQ
jgi:hypothetical protein